MKKTLLFLTFAALMTSGCSKTWSGIKQDSNELFTDTKEAIHEATAPSLEVSSPVVHNNVSSWDESAAPQAANRVATQVQSATTTAASTAVSTAATATTTTVTPMTDGSTVQVFEDTPTVTN